jgi:hypothetical protein
MTRSATMKQAVVTGTVVTGLVAAFAWWALHLYSSKPGPERYPPEYLALAESALARGLRHDSAGVVALSGNTEPAAWLMMAVRTDSAVLGAWSEGEPATLSLRAGDTTLIYWSTWASRRRCPSSGDLTAGIVQGPEGPKLTRLSSPCIQVAPITFDALR